MNGVLGCRKRGLSPFLFPWWRLLAFALVAVWFFFSTMAAHAGPYGTTQCAPSRFGSNLNCTANDVSINTITIVGTPPPSCIGGQSILLDLNVTIQFQSPSRYDVGVFVSADGKNPQMLAPTGAGSCTVAVIPTSSPFLNLDTDSCGDGNGGIGGGTGAGTFTMTNVAVPCVTGGSGTALSVPYLVTWDQGSGNLCSDNTFPVPGTTSKCNTGTVAFPPGQTITVLPAITITDGVTTVRSGGTLTYTVVITNTTASSIAAGAIFTDPAVADLSISSVSCAAAGGATCPAGPTVAAMQGAGITLPAMPNNSSLTFTVSGTYTGSPTIPTTLTNTATITANGYPNSASDTDTVMVPPTVAKSFSPGAIASGGTSTLTITLTNPNAVAISGAAFTDTYPANMKNTTVAATTCAGGSATAVVNGTTLSLSGATIPLNGSCTVTVNVTTTTTGTNTTSTVTSANAATGIAASATLDAISSFNAFETSTAANATSGSIYTKLAGTAFGLDVVAIGGGVQAAGFTNALKVELLGNTVTGVALDAQSCPTSFTLLQTVAPNPTITAGRSTANFTAVANAWRDVRVRVSYPAAAPTVISCSTDNFSIRPQAFTVTADTTVDNPATDKLPAGDIFTMTANSGYNLYTGTPVLDTAKLRDHNNLAAGMLNGSFPGAVGGSAAGMFQYQDVGTLILITDAVTDGNFTSIDQPNDCTADSSNTLVGGKYGCTIGSMPAGPFGRFYPHHFNYTASLAPSCAAGGFTYMDEPNLGITLSLQARSANESLATRYTNGYTTLGTFTITGDNGGTPVDVSARLSPALPAFAWNNGAYTFNNAAVAFLRNPVPDGAYDTFALKTAVTDPDGVPITGSNLSNTTRIRFGRMKIGNAHGSELLPIPIPTRLLYFSNGNWIPNTLDTCTTVAASNFALAFPSANLAACETALSMSGSAPNLAAPGSGNNGWTNLTLNLGAAAIGNTCTAIGGPGPADTPANKPWLQNPDGTNPSARATFGVYKGANEFIYLRENY